MSKVALARIRSLIFYKDSLTLSRRGKPIPQLVCVGKPCKLYTPDVVRCVNVGGEGTEVDWKCEADLPEALRFGRVEVSCEGWSGPGDPNVLKGSCSLEYRLVQVPEALRKEGSEPTVPSRFSRWFQGATEDPGAVIFMIIWTAVLLLILYSFLQSCFGRSANTSRSTTPRPPGSAPGSGGWFPGTYRDDHRPGDPPPYSKYPSSSAASTPSNEGWRPGFWTGAALGGLGTYLFNNDRQQRTTRGTSYDWERERLGRTFQASPAPSSYPSFSGGQRSTYESEDRGEGPSNLGSMRRSVGLGSSNVR